ncbi:hypothetical protein PENFLA_c026G06331 [Penicillium flavigenum]|uniref:Uncharacterized protein n=1 Tax=Penicillium flavigenum TaxID=254877 RepID=A0A1V6STA9_9EURO|nr:hypothetical protein PENFLA_c026G06331 [Penicillium flavigenum]
MPRRCDISTIAKPWSGHGGSDGGLGQLILFITIELLQGSRKGAQVLYKQGARLVFGASTTATSLDHRRPRAHLPSFGNVGRVFIKTEVMLYSDQGVYNVYESEFAQIIGLAPTTLAWTRKPEGKQPPFMFEMGVFLPPFITGLKCPLPELRRQALRYMAQAPPAQGLFMCIPAAHIVAILIGLEENPTTCREQPLKYIPLAQYRICNFSVSSVMDEEA